MPEKYTYLLVDFLCVLFPFLFSFHPRLLFYKHWKSFLWPCLLTAAFFIGWDVLFTHMGIWSFNPRYICGWYIINLPIEEVLFFICIPYACVFSYHCFDLLFRFRRLNKIIAGFYFVLALLLLITGVLNFTRLYTSVTFILLGFCLLYLVIRRSAFLPAFFFCFLFILIPFFLSNGVLTGSFFGRIVVQYNPDHNLGIRMLTIPLEDTFYGMLLLILNVAGYEYCKKRLQQ